MANQGHWLGDWPGDWFGADDAPAGTHPVERLTQARAFGAHSGRRYGAFSGKTSAPAGGHPVGVLTQPRAFGAHTGRRYGSFAGRVGSVDAPALGRRTVMAWQPPWQEIERVEEDEALLLAVLL